jgi:acetyl coenzyme A synthetase (ADP forming)-like protein
LSVHSLDPVLRPQSIAVIGASRRESGLGFQILDNLLSHGFQGPIYPIHPHADAIHSIRAYPRIGDVPGPVDLAVVVVPKELVIPVVRESVDAGVRGFVVISAGFREVGGEGEARERELLEIVRSRGRRMIGPNCMGLLNTESAVRMNATFAPASPPAGKVAFMSQSGAMGLSILDYAETLGIGISMFVSVGNKADVSGNDLLEYWKDDPGTDLILLYIESFGNPQKFVELARAISRKKPIAVVKSGRTAAGARAAASHTGALAQTDLTTDALLRQAGVLRAQTVEELFDLATAFSNQPLPNGRRVAIVTNAGGPGIILADACESQGLEVAPLARETEEKLRASLPEEASVKNPVDMIASATADRYEAALDAVLDDPGIDAAIASFVPPLGIHAEDVARAVARANSRHPGKPLLAVLMGRQGLPAGLATLQRARVPAYLFPESAARALAAMWKQSEWQRRPPGERVRFEIDDERVATAIASTRKRGERKMSEPDALRVLEACGIPVTPWQFLAGDDTAKLGREAVRAAEGLGYPLALKLVSLRIVHKTDVGAVVLGVASPAELDERVSGMFSEVRRRIGGDLRVEGLLLQRMAPSGRETIVGLTRVPRVGPMVMFGLGGIYVEALRDVSLRMCPITDEDANEMVREVKMHRLLEAIRGEPPRDRAALIDALLRLSQLALAHPEIEEMDVNPLVSLERGAIAVDARIQLAV